MHKLTDNALSLALRWTTSGTWSKGQMIDAGFCDENDADALDALADNIRLMPPASSIWLPVEMRDEDTGYCATISVSVPPGDASWASTLLWGLEASSDTIWGPRRQCRVLAGVYACSDNTDAGLGYPDDQVIYWAASSIWGAQKVRDAQNARNARRGARNVDLGRLALFAATRGGCPLAGLEVAADAIVGDVVRVTGLTEERAKQILVQYGRWHKENPVQVADELYQAEREFWGDVE